MPLGGLGTGLALASAGAGFGASRRRVRARQVAPVDIKDVVSRAGEAQGEALQQAIANAGRFGSDFLTSQIGAQEQALPQFFRFRDQAIQTGSSLAERLLGRGQTGLLTEQCQ